MSEIKNMREKYVEYLIEKAGSGDKFYQYEYAMLLFEEENYEEGIKYLEASSKQGYEDATYCLGLCYEQGIYYDIDIEKAKELYTSLMNNHSGYGYKGLADLLFYSDSPDSEKMHALDLYNQGRNKTNTNYFYCDYELGVIYRRGLYVEKDLDKAVEYFLSAYENMDDPEISLTLASAYLNGTHGVTKDLEKAKEQLLNFVAYVNDEDEELLIEFNELIKNTNEKEFINNLLKEIDEMKDECDDDCDCEHHHHH